jgi:class 3 adenylate cyclase
MADNLYKCPECGNPNRSGARFCDECGTALSGAAGPEVDVPDHLAAKLRAAPTGERKHVTVLFADVSGSMDLAESVDAEAWRAIMDRFFGLLCAGVHAQEGTVVQFTGDGIMALFGAPYAQDDHAERALRASRDMLVRLQTFNRWMQETGRGDGFVIGIGLNSGPVMVGTVGSERRLEYTGIGDAVNTASRVEGMTKGLSHQLLLCESTKARLSARHEDLVFVGEREVRGREAPVRLWGLAGEADAPDAAAAVRSPGASSPPP